MPEPYYMKQTKFAHYGASLGLVGLGFLMKILDIDVNVANIPMDLTYVTMGSFALSETISEHQRGAYSR